MRSIEGRRDLVLAVDGNTAVSLNFRCCADCCLDVRGLDELFRMRTLLLREMSFVEIEEDRELGSVRDMISSLFDTILPLTIFTGFVKMESTTILS